MASGRTHHVDHIPIDVLREGTRIYRATKRHDLLDEARGDKVGRKLKWTPETVAAAWNSFVDINGRRPTQCTSVASRKTLPPAVVKEAIQIYGAAQRLKLVKQLREEDKHA